MGGQLHLTIYDDDDDEDGDEGSGGDGVCVFKVGCFALRFYHYSQRTEEQFK